MTDITKALGRDIDALAKLRDRQRKAQAAADALKEQVSNESDALLAKLRAAKLESASGKLATASITELDVPTVEDWQLVHAFILKNKSPELLQKRISVEAWRERVAAGQPVPGVKTFRDIKLNLRKR